MNEHVYRRPREKIKEIGGGTLSLGELIQLVLGTGTSGMPVAKLARSVEKLIAMKHPTFTELLEIPGIGEVYAARILAVLELSTRRWGEK